jgi:hypothetical protein
VRQRDHSFPLEESQCPSSGRKASADPFVRTARKRSSLHRFRPGEESSRLSSLRNAEAVREPDSAFESECLPIIGTRFKCSRSPVTICPSIECQSSSDAHLRRQYLSTPGSSSSLVERTTENRHQEIITRSPHVEQPVTDA